MIVNDLYRIFYDEDDSKEILAFTMVIKGGDGKIKVLQLDEYGGITNWEEEI